MLELDVKIEAADAVLSGTLCLPSVESSFPVVLMLPGSGPLDRNENVEGQRLNIFNTIAHRLVEKGYASLRYDKRGCGLSTGDYFQAGYFDFVEDAIACFDMLKRNPRCLSDRIYALGHSEGALTAMHLSFRRTEMAGIIQLCPSIENIESALLRQASYMRDVMGFTGSDADDPVAAQKNTIERVKNNLVQPEEVERHHIGLKWLREMLTLDVRQVYAKMNVPMLLIAGAKDVQCDPTEIPSIRGFTSALVEMHVIPNLTHTLRFDLEEPSILHYQALIEKPMEPLIATLISQWLAQDDLRRSH